MKKPVQPCNGCKERGVDNCLECPKWRGYTEDRKKYYEYTYKQSRLTTAWLERLPVRFIKKK
jgi:hypothetical protein